MFNEGFCAGGILGAPWGPRGGAWGQPGIFKIPSAPPWETFGAPWRNKKSRAVPGAAPGCPGCPRKFPGAGIISIPIGLLMISGAPGGARGGGPKVVFRKRLSGCAQGGAFIRSWDFASGARPPWSPSTNRQCTSRRVARIAGAPRARLAAPCARFASFPIGKARKRARRRAPGA